MSYYEIVEMYGRDLDEVDIKIITINNFSMIIIALLVMALLYGGLYFILELI